MVQGQEQVLVLVQELVQEELQQFQENLQEIALWSLCMQARKQRTYQRWAMPLGGETVSGRLLYRANQYVLNGHEGSLTVVLQLERLRVISPSKTL